MKMNNEYYSPFVERGMLGRFYQRVYVSICSILFKRIKIDEESILHLKELEDDAKIVYASMQSSQTSLYVQLSLLEKIGYPRPMFAMGFRPSLIHKFFAFITGILFIYRKLFRKSTDRLISDREFVKDTVNKNRSLIFSMMSTPLFERRYVENKNGAIEHLIDLQGETDSPIYIFPQVIFWNKNPERSGSILSMNPTGDNGIIRAIISVLKSSTPGFLRVCAPLNLKEYMETNPEMKRNDLVHLVRETLFENYNHEKRVILGPHLKSRQEMMEMVLDHENITGVIDEEVRAGKKSKTVLRKRAYKYHKEIAADFSILWIMFFKVISNWFFKKVFDGFHYDPEEFRRIREWSKKGTLVFVPSHKSHLDYVIISNLLFQNNFIPPHIVAGANLSFFPVGKLFRKSGAFFMRRSFKGNNLYATVFRQYVKTLVKEGHSIEFFIEGGRSRTGKIISPKMGIVKYLIESIDQGYGEDLIFVPITVNYDRIMEESSYKKELRGKEKTKESTSSFLKSRKLIKKRYGKVYFAVNEPFSMKEFRQNLHEAMGEEAEEQFIPELGSHIIRKINEVVMVTPFALVSAAILFTAKRGFSHEMILSRLSILLKTVKQFGGRTAPVLDDEGNIPAVLGNVLDSYTDDGIIKKVELSEGGEGASEQLYSLSDEERIRINFYKNSILYFTLPVNMMALAFLSSEKKGALKFKELESAFAEVKEIFSREFDYPEILEESTNIFNRTLGFMEEEGLFIRKSGQLVVDEDSREMVKFFAGVIRDFLESKVIVLKVIIANEGKEYIKKDFVSKIKDKALKMYQLEEINCSEAISVSNFNNSIEKMSDYGLVEIEKRKDKEYVKISHNGEGESVLKSIDSYLQCLKS